MKNEDRAEPVASAQSMPALMFKKLLRSFSVKGDAALPPPTPAVPDGQKIYAIGDIHGRLDLLLRLLETIEEDASQATRRGLRPMVVFLGDYVDRGPDSRKVLDHLCGLQDGRITWRFLEGNHEMAMRAFMEAPAAMTQWLRLGGFATLASYGIAPPEQPERSWPDKSWIVSAGSSLAERLPERHNRFLDGLEMRAEIGDYLFVHAGVRPGVSLQAQSYFDLLTIREPFLSCQDWHGKRVVHGHSIVREPLLRPERIAVDTGAWMSGRLSAVALEGCAAEFLVTNPGDETVRRLTGQEDLPACHPGMMLAAD